MTNSIVRRKCNQCGKEYEKTSKHGLSAWSKSKFCSFKCYNESRHKDDGFTSRNERNRRKNGMLKQHTPEWLEKIRSTTKDAMMKPEINFKIRQPRSPLSTEHRSKISRSLTGRFPANMSFGSNNYPNIQRGDYDNSKGTMYFRSKWEANYALYLDFLVEQGQIKSWEYEVDVFIFEQIKFGTRSYRPDFKVFNNNGSFEYHEVKGYMDSKSKTKLKRMLRYYPEIKLILIDTKSYSDIKKKIGKTLNFY